MDTAAASIAMIEERDGGGSVRTQRWPLATDPIFLRTFLGDMFERYWDRLTFGPILDGIAYEWTCPCPPDRIELSAGYLTIGFGGPHFHLCLGPGAVPDTPAGRLRMPGTASLFRSLDEQGAPNSWGFELRNGAHQPMMSIYFDNPFLSAPDRIADVPDWGRLAMWHDIARRHAGVAPGAFDESGRGFRRAAA